MSKKLDALRAEMKKRNIDGFFVPRADEFQGEYVPASNDRLAWITGFTGSAGYAVILRDKAAFFTDGRYTLQAREQVDANDFQLCSVSENQNPLPTISPSQWIEKNLPPGQVFGIDPWVHTPSDAKRLREATQKAGGTFLMLDDNPLDAAWAESDNGRPAPPLTPAVPHPLQFSGIASADKRKALAAALKEKGVSALAVTLPEEICWLLNVRGNDVPCTPFALSYAIVHNDASVDWFIDARKVPQETKDWVGTDVYLHDLQGFSQRLEKMVRKGCKIWIDPATAPAQAQSVIQNSGGKAHEERSPIQMMKARKNPTEIQGTINAHVRDGAAETKFLAAILAPGSAAKHDEITASDLLEKFRREGRYFKDLSFDTISGAGGNGAIVHYRATEQSKKPLLAGPVYLVDSGGQYLDGTTDITRTVAVDPAKVTTEMKDRFTRVLKGHIAVATAVFPPGTTGDKLDVKARAALKEIGLDYAHGTGHGVGSYLSVHEGPCGISPRSTTVPLEAGMIISNEPGYYKENEYGIRIENLVLVVEKDGGMLGFKSLTLAPIDRNLIEPSLLTAEERAWLDNYHAEVRKNIAPLLAKTDPAAAQFLETSTAPL